MKIKPRSPRVTHCKQYEHKAAAMSERLPRLMPQYYCCSSHNIDCNTQYHRPVTAKQVKVVLQCRLSLREEVKSPISLRFFKRNEME